MKLRSFMPTTGVQNIQVYLFYNVNCALHFFFFFKAFIRKVAFHRSFWGFPPLPFCFCFSSVSITKSSAKIQSSPSKVTRRSMQSPQKSAPVPAQRGRKPGRGKPPGQSTVPKKGRSPKNIPLTKSTSHTENLKTRKKSLKPGKKVSPYLLLYFILQNFVVRLFFFSLIFWLLFSLQGFTVFGSWLRQNV